MIIAYVVLCSNEMENYELSDGVWMEDILGEAIRGLEVTFPFSTIPWCIVSVARLTRPCSKKALLGSCHLVKFCLVVLQGESACLLYTSPSPRDS